MISEIGTIFFNLRLARGWTLEEVAGTSNLSTGEIRFVEQGKAVLGPSIMVLDRLAKVFNARCSQIIKKAEDMELEEAKKHAQR